MPEPLVPAEVDLRDVRYMPLDVVRLRDSRIALTASGDEFRAAVLLWCVAWHQVPAASLPADDTLLAQHAGCGRDLKLWRRLKTGALHGFVHCSDGRLYHPVVAEKALEAWRQKAAVKRAREADRERKRTGRSHGILAEFRRVPADGAAGIPRNSTLNGGDRGGDEQNRKDQNGEAVVNDEAAHACARDGGGNEGFQGRAITVTAEQMAECRALYPRPDLLNVLHICDAYYAERAQIKDFSTVLKWLQRDLNHPWDAPHQRVKTGSEEVVCDADPDGSKRMIAEIEAKCGPIPSRPQPSGCGDLEWALRWKDYRQTGKWLAQWGDPPVEETGT
jgi:hypothetical protein